MKNEDKSIRVRSGAYVGVIDGRDNVRIDGDFTADELLLIVKTMREYTEPLNRKPQAVGEGGVQRLPLNRSPKDEGKEDARLPLTAADWEGGPWQPIETAPKDETDIIVGYYFASVWITHTAWYRNGEDEGWWSYVKNSVSQHLLDGHNTPTHWIPSPPPPPEQGCWRGEGGHTSCSSSAEASREVQAGPSYCAVCGEWPARKTDRGNRCHWCEVREYAEEHPVPLPSNPVAVRELAELGYSRAIEHLAAIDAAKEVSRTAYSCRD